MIKKPHDNLYLCCGYISVLWVVTLIIIPFLLLILYWSDQLKFLESFLTKSLLLFGGIIFSIVVVCSIRSIVIRFIGIDEFKRCIVLLGFEHTFLIIFIFFWTLLALLHFLFIEVPDYLKSKPQINKIQNEYEIPVLIRDLHSRISIPLNKKRDPKEVSEIVKEKYKDALKEHNSRIWQLLYKPLSLGGFLVLATLLFRSLRIKEQLTEKKRLDDLQIIIREMENHRIICGYGELGKQIVKEIVRLQGLMELELIWDKKRTICKNLLIVEKNEEKVQFIAGRHPLTGKLGYIEQKAGTSNQKFYIPVLIGDIRSETVRKIIKLSHADTVTSSILQFDSNLKIAKQLSKAEQNDGPNAIMPCAWHSERETLDMLLKGGPHNEILHVLEHTGFVTAAMIKNKTLKNNNEAKILICGNLNLYYVLEGLLLHGVVRLPEVKETDPLLLENIVIFDEQLLDSQIHRVHCFEDAQKFLNDKNGKTGEIDVNTRKLLENICHQRNVGFWQSTFSLIHPCLVNEFRNVVCAVPAIKENPYMYLLPFMRLYKPSVLAILYPEAEKTLATLKLLEWENRWWNKNAPQIVVYAPDETFLMELRKFIFDHFGQRYSIYSPIISIAKEMALLEKMVSTMRQG